MSTLAFMSFGFTEVLVIGTVALLVFGGDLPDVMRSLGRAYGKFRQGLQDMSRPVREEIRRVRDEVPNVGDSMNLAPEPEGGADAEDGSPEGAATPYDVGTPPAPTTDSSVSSGNDPWDDLDEPPPV